MRRLVGQGAAQFGDRQRQRRGQVRRALVRGGQAVGGFGKIKRHAAPDRDRQRRRARVVFQQLGPQRAGIGGQNEAFGGTVEAQQKIAAIGDDGEFAPVAGAVAARLQGARPLGRQPRRHRVGNRGQLRSRRELRLRRRQGQQQQRQCENRFQNLAAMSPSRGQDPFIRNMPR